MSSNSMASISSFLLALEHDNERPDMDSIRVLVVSINQYVHEFISDAQSWDTMKSRCTSKLVMQKREFFEFSEQSVLSNLYWGIENIEAAIQGKWRPEEEKKTSSRLKNSERLLQVPALLDELEATAGIPNRFLVCCSYFYLAVVRNLRRDELQAALHFLQAILVFPGLMAAEFAPEVCENLFPSFRVSDSGDENVSEAMRQLARKYKHWLMYYQVLQYQDIDGGMTDEAKACEEVPEARDYHIRGLISSGQVPGNSSIKCLQDMLEESQSDNSASVDLCSIDFDEESDFEDRIMASTSLQMQKNSRRFKDFDEDCVHWEKDSGAKLLEIIEKAISRLCFSEGLMKCDEDYAVEVTTIYEMLSSKAGIKYSMLKDVILEQLVMAISSSEEEKVIRASVSILTTIISADKSVLEHVKKDLRVNDLARVLKRNVHEAAVLIYWMKPSPIEMKASELLPTLVEVVCSSKIYKGNPESLQLTPPVAALMLIEVLVTAFDFSTNKAHLAEINSPHVLCGLLDAARHQNLEELISLASILVKCMQFDGQCRKFLSQFFPVAPLICLLHSNEKRATITALEFFHEILRIPRSTAVDLLQQIRKEGGIKVLHTLMHSLEELDPDYQLLAANLLLQLDTLENLAGKSAFREKSMQVLLELVASEESSTMQQLSSFILANIGGTFSWTGEPYTVAWLVKKAGLTSLCLQNLIKDFDWSDQSLQDAGIESWCSSVAKSIIAIGKPVFHALGEGLESKIKRVSQDCLTIIAWLGIEIARSPNRLKHSACEILLDKVEQFLHPGVELEKRLLACLCIYNYASGKGMQKVIHFSEGVRESFRRFSSVTWMAEELHRVADYYLPNKSRISCVHTQILEASHKGSGGVTALIYYKGLLYSGFSDGSIKVWDINRQSAILVWDIKEHREAVTCFSLFEPGDRLLSGSADKTIRVWQMVHRRLELIEVIAAKEPVRKLDSYGHMIFVITLGHRLKVFDSSRTGRDICKNKTVKCMSVAQGRVYIGCTDSSMQELAIANNQEREIKAPAKAWRMQTRPVNSIVVYKDWLYSASSAVEGSNIREWRRQCEPKISVVPEKRANVLAMGVVEDFIYLNCSNSSSSLQIWLRNTQHKVGRISSAGSKITSLLTANDTVLCGTETGLIKGWIPL